MLHQLAQELRLYASESELRCKYVLENLLPDLQHQYILGEEVVTFYSASHLVVFDIVSYHHDHPDAYWITWKREQAIKNQNLRYIRLEEKDIIDEATILNTIQEQLFKALKIKVCGMRDAENITAIALLNPDYLGFIFYEKSKRNVGEEVQIPVLEGTIKKVGVFVDADFEVIKSKIEHYQLKAVQLHGNETVDFCEQIKAQNVEVIKVFSVDESFDFEIIKHYSEVADYYLFDTKGKEHGGNGVKFNWEILEKYNGEKPLFLSGGISNEDLDEIKKLPLLKLNLFALDVNSKYEIVPALKDVDLVKELMNFIKK